MKNIYKYWILLGVGLVIEMCLCLSGNINVILVVIGILWICIMAGFGYEGYRFTKFLKINYPVELRVLPQTYTWRKLLTFSSHTDPALKKAQSRMKNYLVFIYSSFILIFVVFLCCKLFIKLL